jgi:hypothetical protein
MTKKPKGGFGHGMSARALRAAACIIVGVGIPAACATEPGEQSDVLGTSSQPLYYRTNVVWDHRDISVCWNFSGFATQKEIVRQVLQGQRSWSSAANVNFVGFGDCGSADIRINQDGTNRSEVGQQSGGTDVWIDFGSDMTTQWTVCVLHGLNEEQCIETNVLHEFGHALSFLHEQNRDDVAVPSECSSQTDDGLDGDATYGDFDVQSVVAYCNSAVELSIIDRRGLDYIYGPRVGDAPQLGDFNGDGRDDIMCRDVISGEEFIDYANSSGQYGGTDWNAAVGWCNSTLLRRVLQGDFNGDSRTDLLCFDVGSGQRFVDYANSSGEFGGTDWNNTSGWCDGAESRRLYVADANGDGRDDLVCHDRVSGTRWVDHASSSGQFGGTDWTSSSGWCDNGPTRRLFVGDFNGDGRDDLLCHDIDSGGKWIDYASSSGQYGGTDWSNSSSGWCDNEGSAIFVGDFNGDGRSDIVCHNGENGFRSVDLADSSGQFGGTDSTASNSWCDNNGSRLFVGDANGDGRDDLVCHNLATGGKFVDYASSSGAFSGTDWNASGWCDNESSREFL